MQLLMLKLPFIAARYGLEVGASDRGQTVLSIFPPERHRDIRSLRPVQTRLAAPRCDTPYRLLRPMARKRLRSVFVPAYKAGQRPAQADKVFQGSVRTPHTYFAHRIAPQSASGRGTLGFAGGRMAVWLLVAGWLAGLAGCWCQQVPTGILVAAVARWRLRRDKFEFRIACAVGVWLYSYGCTRI